MKTIKEFTYAAFVLLELVASAPTLKAATGDLFEADYNSGSIFKFTSSGTRSTFASGLVGPRGLAFDAAKNLFVADYLGGTIYKYTSGGVQTTFATFDPP